MFENPDERWSAEAKKSRATSVRGLFLWTVLVLGGITLCDAIVIHVVTSRLTASNEVVIDEIESIQAMARAKASLYEVARTSSLLAETKDPYFLDANEQARRRLHDYLSNVQGLILDPSEPDMARIHRLVDAYLDKEEAVRLEGLSSSEQMLAVAPVFEEALAALNQSIADSTAAAVETRKRLGSRVRWTWLGAIAVAGVAMILLVFVAWRRIFRSFESIHDAIYAYSSGDTKVRVPEDVPLELQGMARAFNALTASLKQQRINRFEFLLAVAHDLRNPLAALKVTVALAENRARSGSLTPEQVSQQQRRISRQVDRLNRMIEDLVDVTQVEAGRFELNFRVCDLRELVLETYEIFDEASSLHELHLELPEEAVPVRCDETRLGQVLNNLVSNAIKYSPQGGKVWVRLRCSGDAAIVEVEDEGRGIDPDDCQRIFEPFQRGKTGGIPGVGLGLSVAKKLVEAHQGRIEVESQVGEGSTFRLSLRVASSPGASGDVARGAAATRVSRVAAGD